MECSKLFEDCKRRLLRENPLGIYGYKEALFRFRYDNESERVFRFDDSEGGQSGSGSQASPLLPEGNIRQGNLGKVPVEVHPGVHSDPSSEGSVAGRIRPIDQFRNVLSGKISVREVDWKDCDSNAKLQSSLFAYLDKGVLKIANIPKIPSEYEPQGPVQYYGFDSEDNSMGMPHFFQFATRDCVYIASSWRMLFRYVIQEHKLNQRNNVVWGTNIEYDLGNLIKDWDVNKKTSDFKWTKGGLKKFELYYDPAELDWCDKENDIEGAIKVWDTLNHWKMRVADIGQELSLKLGYDFNKLPADYYGLKYSAMDAILSRSYACVQKSYYDKKEITLKFTPGATSLGHYMNGHTKEGDLFCKHRLFDTHDDEEMKWLIDGLRGGRTEVFSLKEYRGKIGYYDINSAYPYSMKFGVFPHPSRHKWLQGHDKIERAIKCGYEGLVDCEVEAKNVEEFTKHIPYLGTIEAKTGRYIFPLGKWKAKYTIFEIRKAISLGYKFRFDEAIVYEVSQYQPFADFVDFCYAIRDEGTKQGDKILRGIGKDLGNNLYGKFGQRLRTTELENQEDYEEKDIEDCIKIGDGVLIEKDKGFAPHSNIIWSIYITAICRNLLYGHMLNAWAAGNEVIYCDTDSIFIHGGGAPASHQTNLGALKHEGDLSYFKAILPKTYIYEKDGKTCYKAKGVPDYMKGENGELIDLKERFLTHGEVEYRKPMKIREAMRRKNFDGKNAGKGLQQGMTSVNAWVTIKKQLTGKYTKRAMNKDGSTKPIVLK